MKKTLLDKSNVTQRFRFRKDLLPSAPSVYGEIHRPNRKGWGLVVAGPPCHKSKSGRSFFANVNTGACKCFGCGFSGDLISYVMKRDNVDFKSACRALGCWDDGALRVDAVVIRGPDSLAPYLVLDFDIDGTHYSAAVKDEPRNYADKIRRFYREASDRLTELGRGDAESYGGELEECWARMALAMDELRKMGMTV